MNDEAPLPELSASDLDELMGRDPLGLSKQDLAQIVAYQRKQRARRASGEKPEKPEGPKISLADLIGKLSAKAPETPPMKRRV